MCYENTSSASRDEAAEITYTNRLTGRSVFIFKDCYRNSHFLLYPVNEEH